MALQRPRAARHLYEAERLAPDVVQAAGAAQPAVLACGGGFCGTGAGVRADTLFAAIGKAYTKRDGSRPFHITFATRHARTRAPRRPAAGVPDSPPSLLFSETRL